MNKNFNESVTLYNENFGQDKCYFLDSAKAKQTLNWSPKLKLSDGIDSTIAWIKKDWNIIKKQELNYIHQK